MMREAEEHARAQGCEVLDIRIVNVRPELSEIYSKLGFVPTGIESAEVIKTATRPVHFHYHVEAAVIGDLRLSKSP